MRFSLLMLASAGMAQAEWFAFGGVAPVNPGPAQQTRASGVDEKRGWTPLPTKAPGVSREELALRQLAGAADIFGRADNSDTTNTWINDETCGWFAGTASMPYKCGAGSECQTSDHVVACNPSTDSAHFFTSCLDYKAVSGGLCTNMDQKTGCCVNSEQPACGQLVWTDGERRSMFLCYPETTMFYMNDVPQIVLDDRTRTTATTPASTSATATGTGTGTGTATTSAAETTTAGAGDGDNNDDGDSTNVGAIVGGVVGGVAGIALIAAAAFFIMLRKRRKAKGAAATAASTNPSYGPVPPADGSAYSPATGYGQPQMAQDGSYQYPPSAYGAPAGVAAGAGGYDPRQSYFDGSQSQYGSTSPLQQYGQYPPPTTAHTPPMQTLYPNQGGPQTYSPPPQGTPSPQPYMQGGIPQHQAPASELESTVAPAGHQTNPVEAPEQTYR